MGYKTYPEYKDSGRQWLGEVPAHWETKRLKYAAPLRNIKIVAGESDLPYIGLENIESWSGKYIILDEANDSEGLSSRFYPDDVLFGKLRPYLAKAFLANFEGVCSSELLVLQGKGIQPEFLVRFVLSVGFVREVDSSTYGAKMPRASWEFIGNLPVTLPPTEEQSTITDFLDEKTTQIDQLIEKKTRFIELLKEKRAALITEAVTGKFDVRTGKPYPEYKDSGVEWLDEIPAHWSVSKIKFHCSLFEQGWSPQCENRIAEKDEYGVMKVGCVNGGKFNPKENKALPDELYAKTEYRLMKGDLLISRANTKELVGSVAVVDRDYPYLLLCDKLYRVRFTRNMNSDFVSLYLMARTTKDQIEIDSSGTSQSMQNISQNTILNMPILVPPREEIENLLIFSARKNSQIDELIEKTQQSINLLKEKRAALITAAVTGKIDVRDWNKEAA